MEKEYNRLIMWNWIQFLLYAGISAGIWKLAGVSLTHLPWLLMLYLAHGLFKVSAAFVGYMNMTTLSFQAMTQTLNKAIENNEQQ